MIPLSVSDECMYAVFFDDVCGMVKFSKRFAAFCLRYPIYGKRIVSSVCGTLLSAAILPHEMQKRKAPKRLLHRFSFLHQAEGW